MIISEIHKKPQRPERVIQFGGGGFLRGFADWMLQELNDKGLWNGSAVIVQSTQSSTADLMMSQNCLYTHIMRGAEGTESKIIDVISRCIKAQEDFGSFLALAKNHDMRFIISNTTEAGIVFDPEDTSDEQPPKSFPAKLTLLLKHRFDLGLDGFIILPCELIERNGDTLKNIVVKYARLWGLGEKFEDWVVNRNIFCNTLVDRINTGYPNDEPIDLGYEDKLINTSEFYHLWVIETEHDIESELPFGKAGLNVIVTHDGLEKYRTRKVRILNGAHTSLVPYALLSGFDTVKSCIDDPGMSSFMRRCIYDEIIPTLDLPKEALTAYADSVLVRFSNPYIKHYLSSIALNSVSKFRVRVLPSILEYYRRFGRPPANLIFAFSKLIEFYRTDMPNDSPDITQFMQTHTTAEILANKDLWGEDLSFMNGDLINADSPVR